MNDAPDSELLVQFARNNSEVAFAALVERHLGLVHSVALRHTADPQHAQDITQAVFIILARKAGRLGSKTVVPGWLYHTARLTAANFQRAEARRRRREQEAFMQSDLEIPASEADWSVLSPQLDEAMAGLGVGERDALVLRFFQNKSMAEVGELLGLAENTAQKRVGRALEKLRKLLGKRGLTLSAMAIAGAVSANSVQAAPSGLANMISAVAVTKGAAAGTSTLTLVKGALKLMAWTKMKTAVIIGAGVLLAAGTTAMVVSHLSHSRIDPAQVQIHLKARFYEVPENMTVDSKTISKSPTGQMTGILTRANIKKLIQSLAQTRAAETLGEPEVITTSGRECQMRATSTFTIVTNLVLLETNGTSAIAPQTSAIETGPMLDVVATASPDGYSVDLNLSTSVIGFEGYDKTTNTTAAFTRAGEQVDVPVISPRFWNRQAAAKVKIRDGETVMLSGMPVIQVQQQWGLPNPLDQGADKPLVKKQLLILITATLVDAAGKAIR